MSRPVVILGLEPKCLKKPNFINAREWEMVKLIYVTLASVNFIHPEAAVGQFILEKGIGNLLKVSDNNPFNIKAFRPNDPRGSKATDSNHYFIKYPTLEAGIRDLKRFVSPERGDRYVKAGFFKAKTPAEALNSLTKAGFAGADTQYGAKIIKILQQIGSNPYAPSGCIYRLSGNNPITKQYFQNLP
jgi:flagellum-specific peptidoglycan hydrolase FlgJ